MTNDQYLVAIDVGSSSIKLAIASKVLDEKKRVQIFALLERPVFGIKRGAITDMSELSKAVYDIVTEAESIIGMTIQDVLIGVNTFGVEFINSEGYIALSDNEVNEDDVDRVIRDSFRKAFNVREKEILQHFPVNFSLDDQPGIRNPIGMLGSKLGCRTITICTEPSSIRNFSRIFQQADLDVLDKLYMPLVSSDLIFTPRQKNMGAVLVDIGYSSTTYTLWENDEILGSGVINIGSEQISSDIAYFTKTSIEIADEIKKNNLNLLDIETEPLEIDIFDPETDSNYSLDLREIKNCAVQRVEEIFLILLENLQKQFGQSKFNGGLVLIGGGANLKGIHEIAKKITGLPVYNNIYNDKQVKFILEFDYDCIYANVISMLIYSVNNLDEIGVEKNNLDTNLSLNNPHNTRKSSIATNSKNHSNSNLWSNIRKWLPF